MVHEVVLRAEEMSGRLRANADDTEALGQLSDESVKLVREAGVMRMLQPVEYGGYAAHPRDFAEAVMATAKGCGSTGWVCGVGGVHPWEMALMDRRLQDEVWGEDPDTWIASPYAPSGMAVTVDGGYVLTGRWQFSSGTDHCDWIFLGAVLCDRDGKPAEPYTGLHVVLPRSDYTIVPDSWNMLGLSGTGSKDIIVDGAFIPDYRVIRSAEVVEPEVVAAKVGRTDTLYKMPFWAMFPLGITSAVIGICEGGLEAHMEYQRGRTTVSGKRTKDDPYALYAISEAASDIAAARLQLLEGVTRLYDAIEAGNTVTPLDRAKVRRDQVRCAWRAVNALDEVFSRSGGNAARLSNPLQRYWRDAHVGLQHAIHVPGDIYQATAVLELGFEPDPGLRALY